jgi:hypothetical protein
MIAEDALDLGKRVFNIQQNIDETQKKIKEIKYHIDNMTEKQAKGYLNYRCDNCDSFHEWEDEIDESAIEEAKRHAQYKIKSYEHDMFHYMEHYETIMGEPYDIEYIVDKIVNNAMRKAVMSFDNNHRLKEMFNREKEQEKNVIVRTIKKLLSECEIAETKRGKFEIATCIMCVIANSPRFLNNHQKFKNTVLAKLNDFTVEIRNIRIDKTEYHSYVNKIRSY